MNDPIRLSIFLPSLYGGGAERVMVMLANEIAEKEIMVDLVVARAYGQYGKYVSDVSTNVRFIDLKARRLITAFPALIRYIRKEKPTAMLSAINMANLLAIAARKIANPQMRLVISERNTIAQVARAGSLRDRLLPLLMRLTYPTADAIIAISHGVAQDVLKYTGMKAEKIYVIHNPINLEAVTSLSLRDQDLPSDLPSPLIIAVGRLETQKDYPTLIEAFRQLTQKRVAHLIILGEGGLREEIQALIDKAEIADYVTMPGFVANPFAWMRKANLFVLSSAWEGFGNVLIEAMACGTSIVSTHCPGGPTEILEGGKWGRLVPVSDPEALAKAMDDALKDANPPDVELRARQFGLDEAVRKYLNVIVGN